MVQRSVILILADDSGPEQYTAYDPARDTTDRDSFAGSHWRNLFDRPFPYGAQPNLDRLTRRNQTMGLGATTRHGLTATQVRASPICSPTRAQLILGVHSNHTHIGAIVNAVNQTDFGGEANIEPSPIFTPLPVALKEAGYNCGMFGKGHLHQDATGQPLPDLKFMSGVEGGTGYGPRYYRDVLGFDVYKGTPRNNRDTYIPSEYFDSETDQLILLNGPHTTQKIFEDATAWINAQGNTPYLCYLPLNAVHSPWFDREGLELATALMPDPGSPLEHNFGTVANLNNLENTRSGGELYYNTRTRAAIEHIDYHLGRMIDAIGGPDPIIIYIGDNGSVKQYFGTVGFPAVIPSGEPRYPVTAGPHTQDLTQLETDPYDRETFKSTVREGGIRVPGLMSFPADMIDGTGGASGNGVRGGIVDHKIDIVDFYATILAWAEYETQTGKKAPGTGLSFDNLISDVDAAPRRTVSYVGRHTPNTRPEYSSSWLESTIVNTGGSEWKLARITSGDLVIDEVYNLSEGSMSTGAVIFAGQPSNGDTVQLNDGRNTVTFEFVTAAPATAGNVAVVLGASAADTAAALIAAVEAQRAALALFIGASSGSGTSVVLTHVHERTNSNNPVVLSAANLTAIGMSGGLDNGRLETNNYGTGHSSYPALLEALELQRNGPASAQYSRDFHITSAGASEVEVQ